MDYPDFDFKNPDYVYAFRRRLDTLAKIRASPASLPALKVHYKHHPEDFLNDWGTALNAKNIEKGLPSLVPFILYPKQRDWVLWVYDHWRSGKPGLTEKTRQMGFSWLAVGVSCALALHHEGMTIGIGSRKQEYVDVLGDPKSLIQKGRLFMSHLPKELRGGWDIKTCAPHMRLTFPETGSLIAGESGDGIGRGNTTSLYIVDEAAFIERPQLIEASLSQTTNCRMDVSTPNGMANAFAQKRFGGKIDVFSFHWKDDPTKDQAWYEKQVEELDPVTVAQELDINYSASVEGVLIPSAWVQAAIDAHLKLKIPVTGARRAALDVADEGIDKNALAGGYGILLEYMKERSGKGDDIFGTTEWAMGVCDENRFLSLRYDADGLGAGVRGDARVINERRAKNGQKQILIEAFRGSAAVVNPLKEDIKGRKNEDYFSNLKAQAWWSLRSCFERTYKAVVKGAAFDPDEVISISSKIEHLTKLCMELSQPTWTLNGAGKIVIDKKPEGTTSPNLADGVMIWKAKIKAPLRIPVGLSERIREHA